MKRSRYVPEAEAELDEQFEFYRQRDPEVASRFLSAVEGAIEHVCEFSSGAPPLARGYRKRVLGKPFKYKIVYKLRGETVVIAAVWADRRDPAELIARLGRLDEDATR